MTTEASCLRRLRGKSDRPQFRALSSFSTSGVSESHHPCIVTYQSPQTSSEPSKVRKYIQYEKRVARVVQSRGEHMLYIIDPELKRRTKNSPDTIIVHPKGRSGFVTQVIRHIPAHHRKK